MNPSELVSDLCRRGATIEFIHGKLRVSAPKCVLTPELTNSLRQLKDQIIDELFTRRNRLDEYLALLRKSSVLTAPDLPPVPPFRDPGPEHSAAWDAWWNIVEKQRGSRKV